MYIYSKLLKMENGFSWCGYDWRPAMEGGRLIHPSQPWYWYSSDVIDEDGNGTLSLSIRRNPKEIRYWDGKVYNPTMEAAMMRSVQSFSYGRFSCEMLMPEGTNLWPSFWLSGSGNWPPEIDIEEGWTDHSGKWFTFFTGTFPFINPSWKTTTNVHYLNDGMEHEHLGSRNVSIFRQPSNPVRNFVEYACEWLPDGITIFADGIPVRQVGKDVAKMMTENLTNPERGFEMNAIINVLCENPDHNEVTINTPMKVRNFKYQPMR